MARGGLGPAAAQVVCESFRLFRRVVFEAVVGDAEGREPGVEEVGVAGGGGARKGEVVFEV
jgi:hypothetical protein